MNENNNNPENSTDFHNNNISDNKEKYLANKKRKKNRKKSSGNKLTLAFKKNAKNKKVIRFGIGITVLTLFCSFLLVMANFLQVNVTHFIIPSEIFSSKQLSLSDYLFSIKYIPQVPVVMFIAGFLGRKIGFISILLYILIGIFLLPVFALGGGIDYITEYSFGYIVAFLPAVIIAGTILKKGYSYKNIALAAVSGVLLIHIAGVIYMTALAYFRHAGINFVESWIAAQSGLKIIYDIIFSFLAILVAKYTRIILWFYI